MATWQRCGRAARAMHTRNVEIILGYELDSPVKFLLCWTPGGRETGGTALGIRVARANGVPVYNLAKPAGLDFAGQLLSQAGLGEPIGQLSFNFS